MKKIILYIANIIVVFNIVSCKKWIDVGTPSTQLGAENIFASDATATASVLAIYSLMETDGLAYNLIINTGRSADELRNHSSASASIELYNNNLTSGNTTVRTHWQILYKYIYQANAVLAGLESSSQLSDAVKKQLEGEARFIRAFCQFYLVNLFGDVPLVTTTDYSITSIQPRNTTTDVYSFIKEELIKATSLLSPNFLNASGIVSSSRTRPTEFAARALLARVYLTLGEWNKAEMEASTVISNSADFSLVPVDQVFLKNSREAIWQLQNQVPGYNAYPGAFLILTSTPTVVSLDTNFVKSFNPSDVRRTSWVKSIIVSSKLYYYPYKYKVKQNATTVSEFTMVLRLGEQYLVRAEAKAMQDKLMEAEADLNVVRNRAGISPINSLSKSTLLDSISQERKWELFAEFGDRWFNLKRTGTATAILSSVKGSNWVPTDTLYPIPLSEIRLNPNLTQNMGY